MRRIGSRKGRSHYPNIVLERGINENDVLFKWYKQCTEGKIERKTGSVVLYDLAENEIRRWDFYNALPCRWIGPRLDAHDPRTFAVERIEIATRDFLQNRSRASPSSAKESRLRRKRRIKKGKNLQTIHLQELLEVRLLKMEESLFIFQKILTECLSH